METTKKYLASFIRAEKLATLTPVQLSSLDVGSVENNLPLKDIFMREKTSSLLKTYQYQNDFLLSVSRAYRFSARYLLTKLPRTDKLIINLSVLDSEAPCHSAVGKSLKSLAGYFTHYLPPQDMEDILVEIKNFTNSPQVLNNERVDVWQRKQRKSSLCSKSKQEHVYPSSMALRWRAPSPG